MRIQHYILIIYFGLISNQLISQPTDFIGGNLNEISHSDIKRCCSGGTVFTSVTIDSTTNLSRIKILNDLDESIYLKINLRLDLIPIQFSDLNGIKRLEINGGKTLNDISNINRLETLEEFTLVNFNGELLSQNKISLKLLKSIAIIDSPNLKSLDILANFKVLQKLIIRNVPKLLSFPQFKKNNKLNSVILDATVNGDITSLKNLKKTKHLSLKNLFIDTIPTYLPPNIKSLIIEDPKRFELKSIDNIKNYKKLKELSFISVELDDSITDFSKIKLDKLSITNSSYTRNIDFIFTFKKIKELKLELFHLPFRVENEKCSTKIEKIDIRSVEILDVNAFFKCNIPKDFKITSSAITELPKIEKLEQVEKLLILRNIKLMANNIVKSENWRIENNGIDFLNRKK